MKEPKDVIHDEKFKCKNIFQNIFDIFEYTQCNTLVSSDGWSWKQSKLLKGAQTSLRVDY